MDSNNTISALKRHFNYPSANLESVIQKEDWQWINNETCLSNVDRKTFPLLNNEEVGTYKDLQDSMHNYEDVIYANRDYQKANEMRKVYCKHLMNHLQKSRNIMRKNNDRISDKGNKISGIRDQGFHRCRALIILPTRNSALEVVKCLRSLMGTKHKVTKKYKKFVASFEENDDDDDVSEKSHASDEDDSDEDEEEETTKDKKLLQSINNALKASKTKHSVKKHGIDFDEWTEGNSNERFLFGVGIDKKLFSVCSKMQLSDIIIGSPMSIRELLDDKKKYLNQLAVTSSVEMVIMDQAEYMLMQNFDNLYACFEKLNQTPRGGSECIKVMNSTLRIHEWALDHCGAKYRQNIIISAILHPFLRKIMSANQNFQGTSIFIPRPKYESTDLLIMAARLAKQHSAPPSAKKVKKSNDTIAFSRLLFSSPVPDECQETFSSTTIVDMPPNDSRMSVFRRKVLPTLIHNLSTGGVVIYFTMTNDLYRCEQLMKAENVNTAVITEDKQPEEVQPIITLFARGAIKYLLLSERYYALTRHRFSAAKHIVYFSTPSFPSFARDFHEFLMHNSRATADQPHNVINICEEELFEQVNSQLAFTVLYGQ